MASETVKSAQHQTCYFLALEHVHIEWCLGGYCVLLEKVCLCPEGGF